jgi:hypothetical protein
MHTSAQCSSGIRLACALAACCVQVIAARSYQVVPVVEGLYDMGNLAAVCRSADGEQQPAQPEARFQQLDLVLHLHMNPLRG